MPASARESLARHLRFLTVEWVARQVSSGGSGSGRTSGEVETARPRKTGDGGGAEAKMSVLWIIHRDPRMRATIARLAAAGEDTVLGAPGDALFEAAPAADVVLIGLAELSGDFEVELQFVHRNARRLREAAWILLPEAEHSRDVRRLFDAIDAEVLGYPPDGSTLRWRLQSAPSRRGSQPLPLSQRPARDALTARFALWFADLENPEIMRAIDPSLGDVPMLIGGEPGTGRGLMVRYIHSFGGTSAGALVRVACTEETRIDDVIATLASRANTERARAACTIWLEDVDRLPATVQRELHGWMEFAPPEGLVPSYRVRWIGTRGDPARTGGSKPLAAGLEEALSTLSVRIPPLSERPLLTVPFAEDTALAWCAARAQRPRRFDDGASAILQAHNWPGNLRELEAVVVQSLSASAANPLGASDLWYGGTPFAPIIGVDSPTAAPPPLTTVSPPAPGDGPEAEIIDVIDILEPGDDALFATASAADLPSAESPPEAARDALESQPTAGAPTAPEGPSVRRLADAVAHEIRNPLSSIQTFAQLLPERFDDPDFRDRFTDVVNQDVDRISRGLERVARFARFADRAVGDADASEPVDATGLLERLIEARRDQIRERRLLVLTELDHDRPLALADADQLQLAFESLIDQSLELVEPRGDLYFASRYHAAGLAGRPSIRILVRCGSPTDEGDDAPSATTARPLTHSLSLLITESIVTAHGGAFTLDGSAASGHIIVLDLPAP